MKYTEATLKEAQLGLGLVLFMDEKHAGTLTVGFKCQAEAVALIGSIRYKVNEEMIVGSLKEGWRT